MRSSGKTVRLSGKGSETLAGDLRPHAAEKIADARHTGRRSGTGRKPKTLASFLNKQAGLWEEEECDIEGQETGDDEPEIWLQRQ
jgi:hypothetical protein